MKQVRCGEDVKKTDSEGTRGKGKIPLEESPRLPERGRKNGEEMIIRPSTSNRTVNEQTVEEHYILFVSITPEEQQSVHEHS